MKSVLIAAVISLALLIDFTVFADETLLPLKLVKALPVEGPEGIQPSGLTVLNGSLFTISDKHDDTIFRVQLKDDRAVLLPHVKVKIPEPITTEKLDFEGITCDSEGNFYLVSEEAFRILRVNANGENSFWISPDLRPYGEKKGLFQTPGAYLEGIVIVGKNQFVVCAEREPRGIIRVNADTARCEVQVFRCDTTKLELPEGRPPDFTGLFFADQTLYALQRNAYAICELVFGGQGFEEEHFWSYRDIVTTEELRYSDMAFGKAEGLCIDTEHIFVILDNNRDHRYSDPTDCRPLLLIMERPRATSSGFAP